MKVHELIKALQGIENQNAEVITEGCDCNGESHSLAMEHGDVIICREKSCYSSDIDEQEEPSKPSRLGEVVKGKIKE
jgi:hypothetical protein